MKPLKITMNAFGPYGSEEFIDFTKLNDNNLFLITGPTGAGKTTIFDAITFALFGEASGEDRESDSFRSQFASDNNMTYIEMEFSLKGKQYYIKRIPRQEKRKTKGTGYTEQKADAVLKESCEGARVYTGVKEVDEKIKELLGINYKQFKQIMMISQGEFRKLLTCDSKEREVILQKLFGTESYKRLENKLKENAKELEVQREKYSDYIKNSLSKVEFESEEFNLLKSKEIQNLSEILTLAEELIEEELVKVKTIEDEISKFSKRINKKNEEIIKGKEINIKINNKNLLINEINALNEKKEYYQGKEGFLSKADKASLVSGYEENLTEREKINKEKKIQLEEAESNYLLSDKNYKNNEEVYIKSKERNKDIEELKNKLSIYNSYVPKVKDLKEKQEIRDNLKKKYDEHEKQLDNLKTIQSNSEKECKELQIKKEKAVEASLKFDTEVLNLENLENYLSKIQELQSDFSKLINMRSIYSKTKTKYDNLKKQFEIKTKIYEEKSNEFIEAQAFYIAEKLGEGDPCPVCGSKHHPQKATLHDSAVTKEELNNLKTEINNLQKEYEEARLTLEGLTSEGGILKNNVAKVKKEVFIRLKIDENSISDGDLDTFITKEKVVALDNIEKSKNKLRDIELLKSEKDKLLLKYNEIEKVIENNKSTLEKMNNEKTSIIGNLKLVEGEIESFIKEIPKKLCYPQQLETEIKKLEFKIKELTDYLENCEKKYNESKADRDKSITFKEVTLKNLLESEEDFKKTKNTFINSIKEQGFSDVDEYYSHKLDANSKELLKKEIQTYKEEVLRKTEQYNQLEKELENIEIIDLKVLEDQMEAFAESKNKLESKKSDINIKIKLNLKELEAIKELMESIEKIEKKYSIVGELSKIAKGDNSLRITFERYVLSAFFEDIISAANMRFIKMTSGRYELNRIAEKGKGLTQSGLDLQVLDNYTGRYRHVKTLSGGESFKASLALALGLADVVQSYSGGVSLDTIFIDEGFGTLDSESLEGAINTLIDLKNNGRLVGIISHVSELKERISAKLNVTTTINGSKTYFSI